MFVKPAEGLTIRDPDLRDYLPAEGRDVPNSEYWNRRLRDRDVVPSQPPVTPSPAAPVEPEPVQAAEQVPAAPVAHAE
jgi:hypothetical protein